MRLALLVVLGLLLGAIGGGAVGIGAGIIWSELMQAEAVRGSDPQLILSLMPIGALAGALCGGVLFGLIASRDGEIQIEPASHREI
jgi:hypothetical protein